MRWFKKKNKEAIIEYPVGFKVRVCSGCGKSILPGEKWTKQIGMWFHRKCFK